MADAMAAPRQVVVYVDDEEENLIVFRRRYGRDLDLATFTDSRAALEYVRATPEVALVITDEVMPGLGGTAMTYEIRKARPRMAFILITGNPLNDQDLMYNSLRHNRFYDFLAKPLDLQGRGGAYLDIFRQAMRLSRGAA